MNWKTISYPFISREQSFFFNSHLLYLSNVEGQSDTYMNFIIVLIVRNDFDGNC
jgi:hypothetical protein